MKILITGTAGFIGFHLVKKFLNMGEYEIVGLDNINDYYDQRLKYDRLVDSGILREAIEGPEIQYNRILTSSGNGSYKFIKMDLEDKENIFKLFENERFDHVINMAAQAGVRYSSINPHAYISSNITGFLNILEACRYHDIQHLIYASSSSVYGLNEMLPFSTFDCTDHPMSFYAVTKISNELMAHVYSHLYNIPTTALRFFTVYGEWGRPDMAVYLFTKSILEGKPIDIYNFGMMKRDFTYIDDITEGLFKVNENPPDSNENRDAESSIPNSSDAPYKIYNLGNSKSVELIEFIEILEDILGEKAIKNMSPKHPGDLKSTFADISTSINDFDYAPRTSIREGLGKFVKWYLDYRKSDSDIDE